MWIIKNEKAPLISGLVITAQHNNPPRTEQ